MAYLKTYHMTLIKRHMYDRIGEHAVSNIVDIIKVRHVLIMGRTIFYD